MDPSRGQRFDASRRRLPRIIQRADRSLEHRETTTKLSQVQDLMPGSRRGHEGSIEASFAGIDEILVDRRLHDLLMHLFDPFPATLAELVADRPRRPNAPSEQLAGFGVAELSEPLGRRGDPLQDAIQDDGEHSHGLVRWRSGAPIHLPERFRIETLKHLIDCLDVRIVGVLFPQLHQDP